jgi:hypothetical protein
MMFDGLPGAWGGCWAGVPSCTQLARVLPATIVAPREATPPLPLQMPLSVFPATVVATTVIVPPYLGMVVDRAGNLDRGARGSLLEREADGGAGRA